MKEENQKESEKQVEIKESIELIDNSYKGRYDHFSNKSSTDPIERFIDKYKIIENGMQMLPDNLENSEEQEEIKKLYKKANEILEKTVIDPRNHDFSYFDEGGKRHRIMEISSRDIGKSTTTEENLKEILKDHEKSQYEQHMGKLQGIINEINRILGKYKIVKKEDKPIDEIIEDQLKDEFKDLFEIKEEKHQEVKKDAKKK
jgi:hypothetical protein